MYSGWEKFWYKMGKAVLESVHAFPTARFEKFSETCGYVIDRPVTADRHPPVPFDLARQPTNRRQAHGDDEAIFRILPQQQVGR
jgi:hypothetical protein